jgi:hypothetical protein
MPSSWPNPIPLSISNYRLSYKETRLVSGMQAIKILLRSFYIESSPSRVGSSGLISYRVEHAGEGFEAQVFLIE